MTIHHYIGVPPLVIHAGTRIITFKPEDLKQVGHKWVKLSLRVLCMAFREGLSGPFDIAVNFQQLDQFRPKDVGAACSNASYCGHVRIYE
ncbi:Uncharacterised protein [Achromobacter xylosoxidans]|nr:Uncharacterised protein [Achromobacter xylosoxidans]